jgi:hypothetical protein
MFFYHLVTPPSALDEARVLREAYLTLLAVLQRAPAGAYRRLALMALERSLMLGLLAWRLLPREDRR